MLGADDLIWFHVFAIFQEVGYTAPHIVTLIQAIAISKRASDLVHNVFTIVRVMYVIRVKASAKTYEFVVIDMKTRYDVFTAFVASKITFNAFFVAK